MTLSSHSFRSGLLACVAAAFSLTAHASEPTRIVFQNGRSVPLSAVTLQGTNLVVSVSADGFTQGQALPLSTADHVFGEKPSEINPAIALLLTGKPADALKLLEPIVESQRLTAKIPGNFWLEAARAALVAYALDKNAAKCTELGKEISDATPYQGTDPFVALGKALQLPASATTKDRETALSDLTTDNLPADICAYASYYLGNLYRDAKNEPKALEAYLSVPCLYPAGGLILNAAAELKASELLRNLKRDDEASDLLKSAASHSAGTLLAAEANKRLESSK